MKHVATICIAVLACNNAQAMYRFATIRATQNRFTRSYAQHHDYYYQKVHARRQQRSAEKVRIRSLLSAMHSNLTIAEAKSSFCSELLGAAHMRRYTCQNKPFTRPMDCRIGRACKCDLDIYEYSKLYNKESLNAQACRDILVDSVHALQQLAQNHKKTTTK